MKITDAGFAVSSLAFDDVAEMKKVRRIYYYRMG